VLIQSPLKNNELTMTHLRHLAIRCMDMELSKRFYTEVIGLEFHDYRPSRQGLDLTDGVNNITLLQQPADCVRPPLVEGNEYIHFGFIDSLEECWQRALAWGAEISKGDVKDRSEVETLDAVPERSFKVLDPDRNVIDISDNRQEWNGVTFLD
jgi:catechol 2,3-dioxygenase-like lactoylglutathione lyase family enzyme